jgi:hypothetical protein
MTMPNGLYKTSAGSTLRVFGMHGNYWRVRQCALNEEA